MIMMRCPKSGKEVATGIVMDKAAFESSEMSDNGVKCPHCGETHVWNKAQARVQQLH
jgi:predicted RNA-binding Zn-ribbon protein involved in translation (DUF1610 family)